jgi:hypothetical protein
MNNKRTLNNYVKNPEARFVIRIVAAIGYVVIGLVWWVLYGFVTMLYRLTCEAIESLFIFMEGLAAVRHKLRQLHKHFSYFEIALLFIGSVAMMLAMVSLLWILAIIVPAGY